MPVDCEIQPQSIVHRVLYLERKITRVMSTWFLSSLSKKKRKPKIRSRDKGNETNKFNQKKNSSIKKKDAALQLQVTESDCICPNQIAMSSAVELNGFSDTTQFNTASHRISGSNSSKHISSHSHIIQSSRSSIDSNDYNSTTSEYSESECNDGNGDHLVGDGQLRTINQNEFFIYCMLNDTDLSIVHFYDDRSPVSITWDKVLTKMAEEWRMCRFLRIDGSLAPFITAKLNIQTLPTVLALNQRNIVDTLFALEHKEHMFGDNNASRLQDWILQIQKSANV